MAATTRSGNAENAIDRADSPADTGTDGSANRSAHRTSNTATVIRTLGSASLHAAHEALRMRQMWNGDKRECECRCRQPTRKPHVNGIRRNPDRLVILRHHFPQNPLNCINGSITLA